MTLLIVYILDDTCEITYMYTIQVQSALFKNKQLSEKCPAVTKGETHANI